MGKNAFPVAAPAAVTEPAWLQAVKILSAVGLAGLLLVWARDWPRIDQALTAAREGRWGQILAAQLLLGLSLGLLVWRAWLVARYRPCPACADAELPVVTVVVPAYNEGRLVLETLRSILASDYPADKLEVIAVDDGSQDDTWRWLQTAAAEAEGRIELIQQPHNQGKRRALYVAFRRSRGEVLVTIDSDSLIDPPTLRRLVSPMVRDGRVGAVAGNVRVLNRHEGPLPLLMDAAFVYGFDFVRAAQSQVGAVLCTPGALSAYRRSIVMPVLEHWVAQTFLGRPAGIGEDRAMTNLTLKAGYHVVFQQDAVVYTKVPVRYQGLCRMLLRWARSNLRESWLMAPYLVRRLRAGSAAGARIELFMEMFGLAFARPISTAAVLYYLILSPLSLAWNLLIGAAVAGVVPLVVYALRHRSSDCLWALHYSVFNVFALAWIPVYALLTPQRSGWLTRQLPAAGAAVARPAVGLRQAWRALSWGGASLAAVAAGVLVSLGNHVVSLLRPALMAGGPAAATAGGGAWSFDLALPDLPGLFDSALEVLDWQTASDLAETLLSLLVQAG